MHAAIPHSHGGAQAAEPGHEGAHAGHDGRHAAFRGKVDHERNGFDPHVTLRDFDWGTTRRLPNGRVLREWELTATTKEIEVAPGVTYAAWVYNDRLPGPTLRAREGERLRITFRNGTVHPHTIHFHGLHPASMDGVAGAGAGDILPGQTTVYEFDAEPFGMHLYHCHVRPLAEHIAKGMYGAFVIDPKQGREEADELVMVMHGLDTNFDGENEIYSLNTKAFAYVANPIRISKDKLQRIFLINITEFDPVNSLHLHGNFYHYRENGHLSNPRRFTDNVSLIQGERGLVELTYKFPGKFMFHAHQSELAELGWTGMFEVV